MRAAIYARFSSDNQRDESIDAQIRACEEYAKRNKITIVRTYVDRAKSATSDKRPEFQHLISDSSLEIFDALIVHKLDRFSRDKYDSATYKRRLKKNGVRLISVLENLDGSPESIILESVIEGMAEYYSKNLAREVIKGLTENALSCRHTGGRPPLGFDVDPLTRKLVINQNEAKIVRIIFSMYNEGQSYRKIISYLNSMDFRTKINMPFGSNSLYEIINNEKYAGVFTFNRKSSKSVDGTYNSHNKKGDDSIIRVENGCPAIISKEEFAMAKERMEINKRLAAGNKAVETYLLTGIIRCGECGKAYQGNRRLDGRKNLTYYTSYRCGNKLRTQQCNNKEIRKDLIEDYILEELEKRLFCNIPALAKKLNEHMKNRIKDSVDETKMLQEKLEGVKGKIANIVRAVASGLFQESFKQEIDSLEEEKGNIEIRLAELGLKQNQEEISEEALTKLLGGFKEYIHTKNIPECKRFIQKYVKSVVVYPDKIDIAYTIPVFVELDEKDFLIESSVSLERLYGKIS